MLTSCRDELANPYRNRVRELLNCLTYYNNEYQGINIELRNLQNVFKQEVDKIIFQCSEKRKLACASEEKLVEFERNIKNIDNTTEFFNKRIANMHKIRKTVLDEAIKCFRHFCTEKFRLKQFNQKSISYLKTFAAQSNNPIIVKNCEKDITEISKQYLNDVSYVNECEIILDPFIQLLHNYNSPLMGTCNCLNSYDGMTKGNSLKIVEPIVNEIKSSMASTLRKTFAQLYIHKPKDRNSFLASYLMTLEYNEEVIPEKLKIIGFHK